MLLGRIAALLAGGGLLGWTVLVLAVLPKHPDAQERPAAALARAEAPRSSLQRVVSAPDNRRFASAETPAADRARPKSRRPSSAPNSADGSGAAASSPAGSKPMAVPSHRLDPADVRLSAAFVASQAWPDPAAARMLVAFAPLAEDPARQVAALVPTEAVPSRSRMPSVRGETREAAAEPEPVETALPDSLPEAAEPPLGARAALERELALAVPMPTARPVPPSARQAARQALGDPSLRRRERAPAALLAYARPDAGAFGGEREEIGRPGPAGPALSTGTAIYDIAAATVYLPNGERLEAHSGLGRMRDDARYVHEKNRGPTPPHTYNLTMRESLFHGVAAIRLTPIGGERRIHNRVGLLAHTYMLGPRGDSNGCVSIKDYKRFLAAFRRGEIRRLVVVPSSKPTSRLASLFRRIKG